MGEYGWLLLAGGAMWAVLLVCGYLNWRHPDKTGCTECGHDTGLNGQHCADVEDDSGWSSSACRCDSDYHYNYESVGQK